MAFFDDLGNWLHKTLSDTETNIGNMLGLNQPQPTQASSPQVQSPQISVAQPRPLQLTPPTQQAQQTQPLLKPAVANGNPNQPQAQVNGVTQLQAHLNTLPQQANNPLQHTMQLPQANSGLNPQQQQFANQLQSHIPIANSAQPAPQQPASNPVGDFINGIAQDASKGINTGIGMVQTAGGAIDEGIANLMGNQQLAQHFHNQPTFLDPHQGLMGQGGTVTTNQIRNASPAEALGQGAQAGAHYAPYFVGGGLGKATGELGSVVGSKVGTGIGANLVGKGAQYGTNAALAAPTFAGINAAEQGLAAINNGGQTSFKPSDAINAGLQASAMTGAGDLAHGAFQGAKFVTDAQATALHAQAHANLVDPNNTSPIAQKYQTLNNALQTVPESMKPSIQQAMGNIRTQNIIYNLKQNAEPGFLNPFKPAEQFASQQSGLQKMNVLNDNEAHTLSDYADMQMKRWDAPNSVRNQVIMQARNAAKTAGFDITNMSPYEADKVIANYLEARDQYKNAYGAAQKQIVQQGFAKVPFGSEPSNQIKIGKALGMSPDEIKQEIKLRQANDSSSSTMNSQTQTPVSPESTPLATPQDLSSRQIRLGDETQRTTPEQGSPQSENIKIRKKDQPFANSIQEVANLVKRNEDGELVPSGTQKPGQIVGEPLPKDVNMLPKYGKGNMEDLSDKQAKDIVLEAKRQAQREHENVAQRWSILTDAIKRGVADDEHRSFMEAMQHPEKIDAILKDVKNPEAFMKAIAEQRNFNEFAEKRSNDTGSYVAHRDNYYHQHVDLSDPADAARYEEMMNGNEVKGKLGQPGYTKERVFPDINAMEQAGFKMKFPNAIDAATDHANSVAQTVARNRYINTLAEKAPGHLTTVETANGYVPVDNQGGKFATARSHGMENIFLSPKLSKAFDKYVEPTNYGKAAKALDVANQALKQSKLALGGFHDLNVTKRYITQEIASGLTGEPKRLLNVVVNSAKQDAAFWSPHFFKDQMGKFRDSGLLDRATHDGNLSLGESIDVGSLNKEKPIGKINIATDKVKQIALVPHNVNEFLHSFLFQRKIPLMKLETLQSEMERAGIPLKGDLTDAQKTKLTAITDQINNMYGGIDKGFIAKTGAGKYVQRLLMLAPDFTGGNLNSAVGMLKGDAKSLAIRQNLGNYLTTVALAGVAAYFYSNSGKNGVAGVEDKIKKMLTPGSPEFLKPSIDLPYTDSKGRHLTATLPGSPAEEAVKAASDPIHFAISRGSALASSGAQLATNQNYYGQPLVDPNKNPNPSIADKVGAVLQNNLPIPAANGIQLQKGTQDVGTTVLNTIGLKVSKDPSDPKVIADNNYYNQLNQMVSNMTPNDKSAYETFQPTTKDRDGNYVINPTTWDTSERAQILLAHPNVLAALQQLNQSLAKTGANVDPFWTQLNAAQQKAVLEHQANNDLYKADYGQQQVFLDNNKWYSQFEQDRSAWYNTLPPGDPNKPKSPIQPPTETKDITQLYAQYNGITNSDATQQAKDRATFIAAHPALNDYMNQIAQYTNKILADHGAQPIKLYPTTDKATQNFMQAYMNAKNPDGTSDSATRKAMKAANPDLYNKMQAYMSLVTEWDLNRQASLDSIQGQQPSQKYLKDVLNMGNYDIYKNPDGSLALNGTSNLKQNAVHTTSASGNGTGGFGSKGHGIKIRKQRVKVRRKKVRYYAVRQDKRIHFKGPSTNMNKTTITPGKISITNPVSV